MHRIALSSGLFLLALAVAGPALADDKEGGPVSPLQPLVEVGKQLEKAGAALMEGKDPAEAFKPWKVRPIDADKLAKLRADLTAAGVKQLVPLVFEVELYWVKSVKADGEKGATTEKQGLYHLRTEVSPLASRLGFATFKGREATADSKMTPGGHPFDAWKGESAKPFVEAGQAIVKALKGPDAAKLPILADAAFGKLLPPEVAGRLAKELKRSRDNLAGIAAKIAALDADAQVYLHLDDQAFVALNAEGVGQGVVRGEFRMDGGEIVYELSRFRPFPKPDPSKDGKK